MIIDNPYCVISLYIIMYYYDIHCKKNYDYYIKKTYKKFINIIIIFMRRKNEIIIKNTKIFETI